MRRIFMSALLLAGTFSLTANAQTAAPAAGASPAAPAAAATPAPHRGAGAQDPEAKARWEKFQTACAADLKTHCGTIDRQAEGARGQLRQCIEANKAKFASECQSAVAERDAARAARKDAQPASATQPKG